MFTYAYSLSRNSAMAEDAVHAVFARLLERPNLPRDLKPFVFKCLKNSVVDEFRRDRREIDPGLPEPDRWEIARDTQLDLDRCMKQLSVEEREIIVLKVRVGMTFQEIADFTGDSINTVASRYRRGVGKIKDLLNE